MAALPPGRSAREPRDGGVTAVTMPAGDFRLDSCVLCII